MGLCFVGTCVVQVGPQQGAQCEKSPPAATHVGQLDISVTVFPVVWDQGKDIWRGPVNDNEGILHRLNQAEDLQYITFESVDLKA